MRVVGTAKLMQWIVCAVRVVVAPFVLRGVICFTGGSAWNNRGIAIRWSRHCKSCLGLPSATASTSLPALKPASTPARSRTPSVPLLTLSNDAPATLCIGAWLGPTSKLRRCHRQLGCTNCGTIRQNGEQTQGAGDYDFYCASFAERAQRGWVGYVGGA